MNNKLIKVVCILGPTASGKTELALQLAKKYKGEIINVDSAQVYRGMDIGTAKLDEQTRQEVPHHLFDIRDPFDSYSASDFCVDATRLIKEIHARGNLPILAGGTMLYFKALLEGMADMPSADVHVRKDIEARAAQVGWTVLHQELAKNDPESAVRIEPNDSQRIQRALEVFQLTGKTLTSIHAQQKQKISEFTFINIALMPADRSLLHEKIERRFLQMMQDGFLNEVKGLLCHAEFKRDASAMRAVGYRQLLLHLLDGEPLEDAVNKSIYATRQLAKRQLTWLRKLPDLHRFVSEDENIFIQVDEFIKSYQL